MMIPRETRIATVVLLFALGLSSAEEPKPRDLEARTLEARANEVREALSTSPSAEQRTDLRIELATILKSLDFHHNRLAHPIKGEGPVEQETLGRHARLREMCLPGAIEVLTAVRTEDPTSPRMPEVLVRLSGLCEMHDPGKCVEVCTVLLDEYRDLKKVYGIVDGMLRPVILIRLGRAYRALGELGRAEQADVESISTCPLERYSTLAVENLLIHQPRFFHPEDRRELPPLARAIVEDYRSSAECIVQLSPEVISVQASAGFEVRFSAALTSDLVVENLYVQLLVAPAPEPGKVAPGTWKRPSGGAWSPGQNLSRNPVTGRLRLKAPGEPGRYVVFARLDGGPHRARTEHGPPQGADQVWCEPVELNVVAGDE